MAKYVLAHDLGTSGNKATLFDENGRLVASAVSSYAMEVFNGNWAEQDPAVWWNAVCESSRSVLEKIDRKELAAVAFSAQMMGCLVVDRNGRPLHKALLYCDQRSEKQIARLVARTGFETMYRITGHRPSASYSLSKLLWIRDNLPDVFEKTAKMLQAKDYMNFLLTGTMVTDYNDASGTNAFDLHTFTWSDEIIGKAGISRSLFPDAVPSSRVIGTVTPWAGAQTGIPAGVTVVAGSGDGGCASVGAGSVAEYRPYCYLGSSSWVSIASKTILDDPDMIGFTWAHPVNGLYQPCATMQTAGSSISWFAETFLGRSDGKTLDTVNHMAAQSPAGANGVTFLPYLLGERSPWWDTNARGVFLGMSLNTGFNDFCRALFEGIAMNLYLNFRPMQKLATEKYLRLIGGGALNTLLVQTIADVFGCELLIPEFLTEATSMGAAALAGIGAGVYGGFDIVESMNPGSRKISPDMKNHELYCKKIESFKKAYTDLKGWFSSGKEY